MTVGKYIVQPHFLDRCQDRGLRVSDAKKIIATATACVAYLDGTPVAGGTCWRVTGTALDGDIAKVGAEAYKDHLGESVILVTIMDG